MYPHLTNSTLVSFETTVADVCKCLSKLDTNKAFGPDALSPRLLKEGAAQLAPFLCRLFNLSLITGSYPRLWKQANVIPLHKKNDKASVMNYRPVSLLSLAGKTMEKVVFNVLFDYLQRNFLLSIWQSGFIPGHSTVTQLVAMYHVFWQICIRWKRD